MDVISKLTETEEVLSENEDEYIEANWRKIEDHSAAANELLAHANAQSLTRNSREDVQTKVIDPLFALERTARMNGDVTTVIRLVEELCAVYFALNDMAALQKGMVYLFKARGQSQQVQSALLKKVMSGIRRLGVTIPFDEDISESAPVFGPDSFTPGHLYSDIGEVEKDDIQEVLLTIRTLAQGKMHVELEYAQASMILARTCERSGNASVALQTLQKVGIERLSAVSRFEKTTCLIYQLALACDQQKFIEFEKIVRKISKSTLENADNKWLYRIYLLHLISYFSHLDKPFAIFLCYWELFQGRDDDAQIDTQLLKRALVFLLLTPPESENERKDTIECTVFAHKYDGKKLTTSEWIQFFYEAFDENDIKNRFSNAERDAVMKSDCLSFSGVRQVLQFFVHTKWISVESFQSLLEASKLSEELTNTDFTEKIRTRFTEKIILIISKYYTSITLPRLAALVSSTEEIVEELLRKMVHKHLIQIKIDHVDGVVEFTSHAAPKTVDILNDSMAKVLDLVEESCHLIEREGLRQEVQ